MSATKPHRVLARWRRRCALGWLPLLLLAAGCPTKTMVQGGLTGVRLVVVHEPSVALEQVRVLGEIAGAVVVPATALPGEAGEPLTAGAVDLVILLPEEWAGSTLRLRVDGLMNQAVVASGVTTVTLQAAALVDATVVLGGPAICGDGVIQAALEACDDGSLDASDGCDAACEVEPGFTCAGAPSVCERCGDGVLQGQEGCDDGGLMAGDGCDASCLPEAGWGCAGEPSFCAEVCGDGSLVGAELCDDGDLALGDGCDASCVPEAGWGCAGEPSVCAEVCGDGTFVGAEACDDGGLASGDGCDASCVVESGWDCAGAPSLCAAICGDGTQVGAEECDDGSVLVADGCDASCVVEPGWGCAGAPSLCAVICGDGTVVGAEECDDGSAVGGDGCDASCLEEPAWDCEGAPSLCSPSCHGHGECPFRCNRATGACDDATAIIFVDCGGSCPGTGDASEPLCSLQEAVDLAAPWQFVAVTGATCLESVVIDATPIYLEAEPGVVLAATSFPTLRIEAVDALIEGLVVSGASGLGGGVVVETGAAATLLDCELLDASDVGLQCLDASCLVERSIIRGNRGGGVLSDGGRLEMSNCWVVENGDASGTWGGIWIASVDGSGISLVNNTVAFNLVEAGFGYAGGLTCDATVTVVNSILWGNDEDAVSGACQLWYCDVDQVGFDGIDGNLWVPPGFLDAAAGDYHLDATSLCIDRGDPAGLPPAPAVDIDLDPRPLGNAVDLGADEAG